MGISKRSLLDWLNRFPTLSASLKKGKAPVDQEVENALYKRAIGYQYEETVTEVDEYPTSSVDENGEPVMRTVTHTKTIVKTALPDTTAQIFWLKNRRPDKWRDKPVTVEDTNTIEKLDRLLEVAWNAAHNQTS